jgi:hypothetical protein
MFLRGTGLEIVHEVPSRATLTLWLNWLSDIVCSIRVDGTLSGIAAGCRVAVADGLSGIATISLSEIDSVCARTYDKLPAWLFLYS